jgi:SET domain-containing protein
MNTFRIVDMPNGNFNKVEVKESKGKGLGVFATKKIKSGEIICWYDGIFVSINQIKALDAIPTLITGKNGYSQFLSENECIAGFSKVFRNGGVGQLINDYSTTTDPNEELINMRTKKYNCDMERKYDDKGNFKYLYFIALKNIKKGEEILHHYGVYYWENIGDPEAFTKMMKLIPFYNIKNDSMRDYVIRARIVECLFDPSVFKYNYDEKYSNMIKNIPIVL